MVVLKSWIGGVEIVAAFLGKTLRTQVVLRLSTDFSLRILVKIMST